MKKTKIIRMAMLILIVSLLANIFTACKEPEHDLLQRLEKIMGAKNGVVEFDATPLIKHVAMSSWNSMEVRAEDGILYCSSVAYHTFTYTEEYQPSILESDLYEGYKGFDVEQLLEKIEGHTGWYLLAGDSVYKMAVGEIDNTFYFLGLNTNDVLVFIHSAN